MTTNAPLVAKFPGAPFDGESSRTVYGFSLAEWCMRYIEEPGQAPADRESLTARPRADSKSEIRHFGHARLRDCEHARMEVVGTPDIAQWTIEVPNSYLAYSTMGQTFPVPTMEGNIA
jgi:hypothetical protein